MTENIKIKISSPKEDKKINKPSDIEILLSGDKKGLPIHLRNLKIINPLNLKNDFVDLDEGAVSITNAPSKKSGERIKVQFESLPVFQLFCEKYNRFKFSSLYLQESVIAKEESRGGVLNQEDIKKIIDELDARMKSFEKKLKDLDREFASDFVLPEQKTYKLICSQNSLIANHFIEQTLKADRIICVLDYLYSKGKLGSLLKGMQVRNKTTTAVTQTVSRYMDSIIHLEEGVKNIRLKRLRERDLEEKRLQKEREEAQRQAENLKHIHKQEGAKARKEKAQMRATAKVYKPDENGRMVLVETRPERRTKTPVPTATVSTEQVEQDEPKQEPQQIQAETVKQAADLPETVKQEPADSVLPEPPEVIEVPVEQAEETKPVSEVATQQAV